MASTSERSVSLSGGDPAEEVRRLFRRAEELETHVDRVRYGDALKAFLVYGETHATALNAVAGELAGRMDEVAMSFYRISQPELAMRAVESGLRFAPGSSALLHHKALILLSQNQRLDEVANLLDKAIEANPHDKGVWATKGDALRLLNQPEEAAEAYLRAQQLDATSTQYVDRALKLSPRNATALRMKLQLAKALGGDKQALEACNALLAAFPDDPGLLTAQSELLANLGDAPASLAVLEKLPADKRAEPRSKFLHARLILESGRTEEALAEFRELVASKKPPDAGRIAEMAALIEKVGGHADLAIEVRLKLKEHEPRNLANLQALRTLAQDQKRTDLAIEATQAILTVSPENLDGLRVLAELRLAQGVPEEAFEVYRQIVRAHPKETGEFRKALVAAKTLGRMELVKEFAQAVLAAEPKDHASKEELARAWTELGDPAQALEIFDQLLKEKPSEVAYLLERRRLLAELDRVDDLPRVYDELFRLDPTRHDIALERGNLYLQTAYETPEGSSDREMAAHAALVSYERASLDAELKAPSLLGLARASHLVGDHERATEAYREFLALPGDEERAVVNKELGHAFREINRLTEAEEAYETAVKLGLEDIDLFWGLVEVLSLLNQDAKALRYADLVLQLDPANPLFLRRKGQLLLKSGRRSEGLDSLRRAVETAHGDPHARFEVAEALRSQGAYPDAIRYYEEGLAIDPKSRPGRLALAETLILAGRYNEAISPIDRLLREDPNDVRAWVARADAYRALRRPPEVLYSLRAVLLLEPHNASALTEKARLHVEAGEKKEAFEALNQLLHAPVPESMQASAWLELGDLGAEVGNVEAANQAFERASQLDPATIGEVAARRARLRLNAGRPDLALEVLDHAASSLTQLPPERQTATLLLRARILLALERPAEALTAYEDVRKQDPKSAEAAAGVARCALDRGHPAESREFLNEVIPTMPPDETLFLLLSESQSALGNPSEAVHATGKGVEALPRSVPLWVRLGELHIRQEQWAEAANAFGHAIALDTANAELQLRAGFVAEKLGHPHEALALYDRATQVAPGNKYAWSSRGLALLSVGRPEEAQSNFDRALALDSDFEAAKDGKKAALQRTRQALVERHGRDALILEAKLQRTVTKNDLFVTLHVPFDLLDPVLQALSRTPRVDVQHLSEAEMRDLESASYHLSTQALDRRPEGIERRGFTLADVAVLAPATNSLAQTQRLFGYLKAVLEAEVRPENLKLTADVEELARKALALPENERTLFQLVKTLRVGVFKARLIKAVEAAGSAVHSPLPALDLGQYSPEFQGGRHAAVPAQISETESTAAPAGRLGLRRGSNEPPELSTESRLTHANVGAGPRCLGCGGIASIVHRCGAPMCRRCVTEFPNCPKCGEPISATNSTRLQAVPAPRSTEGTPGRTSAASDSSKPVPTRPEPGVGKKATTAIPGNETPAPSSTKRQAEASAKAEGTAEKPAGQASRQREPHDDEPRL